MTGDMRHETIMDDLILGQRENQIHSTMLPREALSDHIKSHPDREQRSCDPLCPSSLRIGHTREPFYPFMEDKHSGHKGGGSMGDCVALLVSPNTVT